MKKIFISLFILFLYVNWVTLSLAADPTGVCVLKSNVGGVLTTLKETEVDCRRMANDPRNGSTFVSWTADRLLEEKPPVSESLPVYKTLSPLPCEDGMPGCKDGLFKEFDPKGAGGDSIGGFLNIMIRIFIGICAILAVIMIVLAGLEYMTSELVSSKESAKHRMSGAIFGLLLALGSWTLLNEINPNLLKSDLKNLRRATATISLDIMEETETYASALDGDSPFTPGITTSKCPQGIIRTQSGAPACKTIASQFDQMVAAAKAAGKNISGYGYRNEANQKQLRINNCNGNFTDRSATCSPETALPGASNHNHGLAFDLRCNNVKIGSTTNECFVWLQANAGRFGLRNLPSEPWHWSIDGR